MEICKPKERQKVKKDDFTDVDYNPTTLEERLDIVRMEADKDNDVEEVRAWRAQSK